MKRRTWQKHHRWLGLVVAFFLLMFCLSGIVLNHPMLFSGVNVSRSLLPGSYAYRQWNQGLLRGTLRWQGRVLVYGSSGVWQTDGRATAFGDMNRGLPPGADARNMRGLAQTPDHRLYAAGQYQLFVYDRRQGWTAVDLPKAADERLTDITVARGLLVVTSRSHVYTAAAPYRHFRELTLPAAAGDDGKVSLFRTVWMLHSGELFGLPGRLVVDAIGLTLVFLTLTGVLYWLSPRLGRRLRLRPKAMHKVFSWHNGVGRTTIALTLFIVVSGWMLRPPGLIAIVTGRVPPVPMSAMDSPNPWRDALRALRYDAAKGDWLLYTSKGFFSMKTLRAMPVAEPAQPRVSVMGLGGLVQEPDGRWLVGSFDGMYAWRRGGSIVPMATNAVSGLSLDFDRGLVVADYEHGSDFAEMPQWMARLPMSLKSVCLEIHTGRIYTWMGSSGILLIFLAGMAIFWCLWSGWKLRR